MLKGEVKFDKSDNKLDIFSFKSLCACIIPFFARRNRLKPIETTFSLRRNRLVSLEGAFSSWRNCFQAFKTAFSAWRNRFASLGGTFSARFRLFNHSYIKLLFS
jgi:hypothetical protein